MDHNTVFGRFRVGPQLDQVVGLPEWFKTVALINADDVFGRAATQGTSELAKKKGFQMVFVDAYPEGTTDFSTILTKVRAANPDVLGGATIFEDAVAITRQMKALNANPRMVGLTVGVDSPKFHEVLGVMPSSSTADSGLIGMGPRSGTRW